MEEWFKTHSPYIICIIVLLVWGIRKEKQIAPVLSNDTAQIDRLNKNLEDLKKTDIKFKFPCGLVGNL